MLFGVVIDITEHKRAEARQAAEHDRQAESRRLEALGQLAGGVAHDINNVLQTISAASGMIEARADQSSEVVRLGLLIGKATERAAAIVGRLLVFAHCSPLRAEAVDPAVMLRGLPDLLDQVPGSAIEIRLDLAADLPLISADAAQLEAVMVNLVTNARDAVQAGGAITLSARPAQCGDGEAPHADLLPGRYVSLSITDQGTGMSEATLERAIEPFFTTKPRGRGTGLGLSMAAGFAKQSGGALSLSSRKGLGTCVTLWLPEADAAALAALARRPVEGERRAHAGKTILLVDDEGDLRTLLAEELVERGYTVIQKEDGLAARIWIEQREPVDLLVTDLSMPELDGVSLIQAAQAVHPDLPAILLTGHALDIGRFAPHRAAGCHYTLLSKPIRAGALVASIARLLDAKSHPGAADAQEDLQDDQRVSAAI